MKNIVRIAFHICVMASIAGICYTSSRGSDGSLFAGTALILIVSALRSIIELMFNRGKSMAMYLIVILLSPAVAYLAMLPNSKLEEMGGMLFMIFPVASIAGDVLLFLPNAIMRRKHRGG